MGPSEVVKIWVPYKAQVVLEVGFKSTPSNLNRQKDQTYFQTKSSNWNRIPARHPARKRGEMGILQKAAVRTSNSFDVLNSKMHHNIISLK
jgi:hypothetical protein